MIGSVWALPCSLLGHILAAIGGCTARVRRGSAVIFVAPSRGPWGWFFQHGFAAITIGEVIVLREHWLLDSDALVAHELRHVDQYRRLGVLFFLAYPLASLVAWVMGRPVHAENWFELDAARAARREP